MAGEWEILAPQYDSTQNFLYSIFHHNGNLFLCGNTTRLFQYDYNNNIYVLKAPAPSYLTTAYAGISSGGVLYVAGSSYGRIASWNDIDTLTVLDLHSPSSTYILELLDNGSGLFGIDQLGRMLQLVLGNWIEVASIVFGTTTFLRTFCGVVDDVGDIWSGCTGGALIKSSGGSWTILMDELQFTFTSTFINGLAFHEGELFGIVSTTAAGVNPESGRLVKYVPSGPNWEYVSDKITDLEKLSKIISTPFGLFVGAVSDENCRLYKWNGSDALTVYAELTGIPDTATQCTALMYSLTDNCIYATYWGNSVETRFLKLVPPTPLQSYREKKIMQGDIHIEL